MIAIRIPGNKGENILCFITEFVNGVSVNYRFGDEPQKTYSSTIEIENTNEVSILLRNKYHDYLYKTTLNNLIENSQITIKT